MATAGPVNHRDGFVGGIIEVDYNFLNECTDDPLLGSHVRRSSVPDAGQLSRQGNQTFPIRRRRTVDLVSQRFRLTLKFIDPGEGSLPSTFQFSRDPPLIRVNSLMTSLSQTSLIPGVFDLTLELPELLVVTGFRSLRRKYRRVNGVRGDREQQLAAHFAIQSDTSHAYARCVRLVQFVASAEVPMAVAGA
jgi:hypothetical protein